MIELIGMLACVIVCVLIPVQTAKFRAGSYPKNAKVTPAQMLAAFRKQLSLFIWLGLVFGVLNAGLIFMEDEPGEWVVKLVACVLWFAASGIAFVSRRSLPDVPAALPGA
ncbi:MAG TPA: hypothetical protein VN932_03665 [Rhizomicrobium sp.]|nr:hypothetical protein [Rhizomicrobium sp.]